MSPRSSEQNEKIREERIQQIIDAAIAVYLEKGVRGTEMGDIAKRANMARGLVYYYFKDKMDLFRFVFTRLIEEAKTYISSTLLSDEEVISKLRTYARFYLRSSLLKPHMVQFYRNIPADIPFVFGDKGEAVLKEYVDNATGPLHRVLEQGIREGKLKPLDPRLISAVYWGGLMGGMNAMSSGQVPEEQAERVMDDVIDILLDGIVNKKG
ncbi:TetR/AcrR family transcriptional regulator [Paenibacillus validus]|uniref:TetR/AcrR family transcriptional regulator n=1 Tax=Paenibacillus validus TaxID=44253 RepID=UPI003D2DB0DB